MKKEIRLQIRVRNNLVLSQMEKLGIKSVRELCRMGGFEGSYATVVNLINFRASPLQNDSDPSVPIWIGLVEKIAVVLETSPELLFSESLRELRANPNARTVLEVSVNELRVLTGQTPQQPALGSDPELGLQVRQVEKALVAALATLKPKEEAVLKLCFGLEDGKEYTPTEIAAALHMTTGGVQFLKAQALRKMRFPTRSKPVEEAGLDEYRSRRYK